MCWKRCARSIRPDGISLPMRSFRWISATSRLRAATSPWCAARCELTKQSGELRGAGRGGRRRGPRQRRRKR
eukprot:4060911-Prymnesium_polylepis.1